MYPPEGHFNQVPRAHLPLQFRGQVIMKDARYLGHVDGYFKVGCHTAGGALRLKESWAMRIPSMLSARRRSLSRLDHIPDAWDASEPA